MTSVLAAVRPDSWNFPLLMHVAGAMILVGGLLTGSSILFFARGDERSLRLGYWTLLAVALPGLVLMRIGAGWIYSKEGWDDLPDTVDEPAWLGIGYITADAGGLLFLVSLAVGGFGIYRLREGRGAGLLKATTVLSLVLLAAYLVTVWAMAGKPGQSAVGQTVVGIVALIRPDSWNPPLLVHVLGAMVLVGGLLTAATTLACARGDPRLLRLGQRSLLAVCVPAWVLMFAGAEWIYGKEGLDDEPIESAWVLIGFLVAELGGVLLVVTVILGGIGLRRLRAGHGATLMKTTTVLSFVLLVAYAIAVWAMAAKPD